MIFILIYPTIPLLCVDHELVISESRIDKRIDKGAREITPCRINARC
jgi:hypothetical protein